MDKRAEAGNNSQVLLVHVSQKFMLLYIWTILPDVIVAEFWISVSKFRKSKTKLYRRTYSST